MVILILIITMMMMKKNDRAIILSNLPWEGDVSITGTNHPPEHTDNNRADILSFSAFKHTWTKIQKNTQTNTKLIYFLLQSLYVTVTALVNV